MWWLDWGEGYSSYVRGFTRIEMRLWSLYETRSNLKYLLDSLFYLAESQAPYIHVILSYVVSITWYINQPLVRLLLCIINPQSVWYHLHRFVLCNDPIQFLVGIFSFKSEYISPYSISTLPLNWTIYDNPILFLNCSTLTTGKDLVNRSAGLSTPAIWKGSTTLFLYCSQI